jgi:hypothetical protein
VGKSRREKSRGCRLLEITIPAHRRIIPSVKPANAPKITSSQREKRRRERGHPRGAQGIQACRSRSTTDGSDQYATATRPPCSRRILPAVWGWRARVAGNLRIAVRRRWIGSLDRIAGSRHGAPRQVSHRVDIAPIKSLPTRERVYNPEVASRPHRHPYHSSLRIRSIVGFFT